MLDKIKIARSFSRSAMTYDSVAYLQREVGLHLLSSLSNALCLSSFFNEAMSEGCCIDLGCGTGFFYHHLKERFPQLNYCGVDLAEGMLHHCKNAISDHLLCADAEALPIKGEGVSLIFSNMALQWCENLPLLFNEMNRVLLPGGLMVFNSLGEKTLYELKQSWAQVDDAVHVNQFADKRLWSESALENGFDVIQYEGKNHILWYDEVTLLLKELKLLGAHNINRGQPSGLTGRRQIGRLLECYESFREDNGLPATYEVDYWILQKRH